MSWAIKDLANCNQLQNAKSAVLQNRAAMCELEGDRYEFIAQRIQHIATFAS